MPKMIDKAYHKKQKAENILGRKVANKKWIVDRLWTDWRETARMDMDMHQFFN
jgi:hypothetical protein